MQAEGTTTAQGAPASPEGTRPPPQGQFSEMLLMFGLMFVVLYLLVLRPQQRREKERQAMLKDLKKNDRVLTSGGLYGVVMNLSDEVVTLKVDENHNVRMRFARSAIASVVGEGENGAAVDDGKKEA